MHLKLRLGRMIRQALHAPAIALLVVSLGTVPGIASASAPQTDTSVGAATTATAAPVAGEIVVQPRGSIADVNAKYSTTTLFQFTDSTAALIATPDLNKTLAG